MRYKGKLKGFSVAGFALLILAAVITLSSCSRDSNTVLTDVSSLKGGETRPTLSPAYYYGDTAKAYAAAKEIPEVLDSLYCYCDCKKHLNHKSLLTCYVSDHASYCDICIGEALMAKEMHGKGKGVLAIRKAVDEKYARKRR